MRGGPRGRAEDQRRSPTGGHPGALGSLGWLHDRAECYAAGAGLCFVPWLLPNVERQAAAVLRELERHGVLLETDARLPSLVAHVAGGPVQGSWWGHPLGHTIFAIGEILLQNRDVLLAKLISGKATWIHRRLWPALLAVALSREAWQMEPLSREARILLGEVDRDGEARAYGAPWRASSRSRLLARGEQAHTASGRHAKVLESWPRWAARLGVKPLVSAAEGRRQLEGVLDALNTRFEGRGRLPWQRQTPGAPEPRDDFGPVATSRVRIRRPMAETGKFLFRKVEKAIEAIERTADASATIMETASTVIEQFSEVLGVRGGRLYVHRDGGYELVRTFGNVPAITPGLFIPEDYVPIQTVVDEGVTVMDISAPGVDAELERRLGAERFAAIAVGDDEYILSFSVDPAAPEDDLLSSLGILRLAVDQKLRQDRYVSALQEARRIQMSILPKRAVRRGSLELAGFTTPGRARRRRLLRLHLRLRPDPRDRDRRRLGPRPAGGSPGARRLHGSAHGGRARLQDRAHRRAAQPHHPRVPPDDAFRVALLRRDRGRRQPDVRQRRAPAPAPFPRHERDAARPDRPRARADGDTPRTAAATAASSPATRSCSTRTGWSRPTATNGEEFGPGRLTRAFLELRERPCDEIARELISKVNEWSGGGDPEDDRTVVVLKRHFGPAPADDRRPTSGTYPVPKGTV